MLRGAVRSSIMKIYTKTGDDGSTGLFGGARVSKSDSRIEGYGVIDEINAAIGVAASVADEALVAPLRRIQNELFIIGSHLVSGDAPATNLPTLQEGSIARLELEIDTADASLSPLKNFILPGGTDTAARLHLARTICRRAERLLVQQAAPALILMYLNRLSDWLFIHARFANHRAGVEDILWKRS